MVTADIDVPAVVEHVELPVDDGRRRRGRRAKSSTRLTAAAQPGADRRRRGPPVPAARAGDRARRTAQRPGRVVVSRTRRVSDAASAVSSARISASCRRRALRETVEQSDCVLLLGELVSDTSLGVSADCLSKTNLLIAVARDVYIGHHRYQNAPLDRLVPRLLASPICRARRRRMDAPAISCRRRSLEPVSDDEPIKVRHVIAVLNEFLAAHVDVPLVVRHRRLPVRDRRHPRERDRRARPTTRRWGLPCRRRSACRSPAGGGRSCSSATARFR